MKKLRYSNFRSVTPERLSILLNFLNTTLNTLNLLELNLINIHAIKRQGL